MNIMIHSLHVQVTSFYEKKKNVKVCFSFTLAMTAVPMVAHADYATVSGVGYNVTASMTHDVFQVVSQDNILMEVLSPFTVTIIMLTIKYHVWLQEQDHHIHAIVCRNFHLLTM